LLVLAIASACAIWLYYQILEFVPIKESWLAWLIHAILFTVLNGLISFALYSVAIKDFRGFWMRLFHYKKGKG
jgi:ABC-type enterochelin transport system permease subunit